MLFDLFRTCSTRERFRYSNAGIELSLTSPHRANMENNQLAVQDISNYHGYDDGKCLSCPCLPYWQKINTQGVHKYCFSCYVYQGGWGVEVEVAGGTRGSRVRAEVSAMELIDPGDMSHQLFSASTLGLGGKGHEGRCSICAYNHAAGVCKTCSDGLGTARQKLFWLCHPGAHGRQCYCQNLHDQLE
jgi:hypothetical protein